MITEKHAEKKRIRALDTLRGSAITLMVLHHIAYSYRFIFNGKIDLYSPFLGIAIFFVCLFFFISGISSHLSRSNLTRALKTIGVAYLITLVTYLFNPSFIILFGVIHCLGSCMLIYAFVGKYTDRLFSKATPYVYILLFILTYILLHKINPVSIPHLYMFGLYDHHFYSSDYYSIFPWIFMFFLGGSVADLVINRKFPKWFYRLQYPPVEWAGKHALLIYVLHQPIVYCLLFILVKIFPFLIK